MNPFTQTLLAGIRDADLVRFVTGWDRLERLVIQVYKHGETNEAAAEYRELRSWLQGELPRWQARLEPFWKSVWVGGAPAQADPFVFLLSVEEASGFVNHWAALQNLPAAREAINEYLISIQSMAGH